MSIRGFHILFIALATLFCALFAVWAFVLGVDEAGTVMKVLGGFCAAAALGLPFYGVHFYRKAKNILL